MRQTVCTTVHRKSLLNPHNRAQSCSLSLPPHTPPSANRCAPLDGCATDGGTLDPLAGARGASVLPAVTLMETQMTNRKTDPKADYRRRVRALLERLSPGTLAFLDLAKARFPTARMTALEVELEDGTRTQITIPKTTKETT